MTITADELSANLDNPTWRINHLYKIIIKGDGDNEESSLVIQFRLNRAQRRLVARLHHRNIILKARQLGFTTLVAIVWLDTALFSKSPIRCGIIAQDREAAEVIFRDKVKFAYENLPEALRNAMPLARDSATELLFAHNNSSIRVATSMRSGTIHRLHVSEFGKICAKHPDKAREVVTGSIPAVPKSGILVIESTAEGREGEFYNMVERARALDEKRQSLSEKDYRFHFFPWWEAPEYEIDPKTVAITPVYLKYFAELETKIGQPLSDRKRAWYVATVESDFSGDQSLMWQEYPGTPDEAFQVSTEGCWYAEQLSRARKEGRILRAIPIEAAPVNTFWDLGRGDATAIWLHQRIGLENRFVRYFEGSGEDLSHYAQWLQGQGLTYGRHYVPHDATHRRLGIDRDTNRTVLEMLQTLMPGQQFEVVPRVTDLTAGIQATRNVFSSCYFDETHCADGLKRLGNYKKEWDQRNGCWKNTPRHDDNSHGADAFRQFGQEADNGNRFPGGGMSSPTISNGFKRRGSPMAV